MVDQSKEFTTSILQRPKFQEDLLDRVRHVDLLTKLLLTESGPFVLSINGSWGSGKTTFVTELWQNNLAEKKIKYLHFNAWENDHFDDPLIPFVAEMKKSFPQNFEKMSDSALGIMKTSLPEVVKLVACLLKVDAEQITDLLAKVTGSFVEQQIQEYQNHKEKIEFFKSALSDYAKSVIAEGDQKALWIFVDELDRCKPVFALELLERIKHVFNADNLVFILAIDRQQLENCVKTVYGTDCNVDGYLRRFINMEFKLPPPATMQFINDKFNELGLTNSIMLGESDIEDIKDNSCELFEYLGLSVRDIEHILCEFRLFLDISGLKERYYLLGVILALSLKASDPSLYEQIKNWSISSSAALTRFTRTESPEKLLLWVRPTLMFYLDSEQDLTKFVKKHADKEYMDDPNAKPVANFVKDNSTSLSHLREALSTVDSYFVP